MCQRKQPLSRLSALGGFFEEGGMRCFVLLSLLAAVCGIVSCTGMPAESLADVFSNMPASRYKIENKTGEDIVLFRDTLSSASRIGGVKAGETYGMRERAEIEGLYVLRAISFADYEHAVSTGSFADARIVDSTIVFVNMSAYTTNTLLNKRGAGAVRFVNSTGKYLEVYSNYWGEAQNLRTVLTPDGGALVQHMPPAGYTFYFSEVTAISNNNQIRSLTRNNLLDRRALQVVAGVTNEIAITPGGAENTYIYINVKNSRPSEGDAVHLLSGSGILKSTLNHIYINGAGGIAVFQLPPQEVSGFHIYSPGILKFVGLNGYERPVNPDEEMRLYNGQSYYFQLFEDSVVTNAAPF